MNDRVIYLDNAATSYRKPEQVYRAVDAALRHAGSAGRGAHGLAMAAARMIFEARTSIADFLGASAERLIFTPGCTYSLNFALKGFPFQRGDTVLVSALEHNAVMRPLHQLERTMDLKIVVLPYSPGEIVSPQMLIDACKRLHPRLCVFTEGSNVTGEMLSLEEIADVCGSHKVPLLIDAAQTAGRQEKVLQHEGITMWAAPAHKGLFGPSGLGLLHVRPDCELEPLVTGGTGSSSENLEPPRFYPDHLEPGTQSTHSIAGLAAGVQFLLETGVERVREQEALLTEKFRRWCEDNKEVRVQGKHSSQASLPILSLSLSNMTPDRVADLLDTEYGIAVRAGLHCAALAHRTLGTTGQGTVRVSFGYFNNEDEVDALCAALATLTRTTPAAR